MSFRPLSPYLCQALLQTFREMNGRVPWDYLHTIFEGIMDFEHCVGSFHAAIHESGNIYFNHLISALGYHDKHGEFLDMLLDKIPVREVYRFAWLYERDGIQQIVMKGQVWFDDRAFCESEAYRFTPWLHHVKEAYHPLVLRIVKRKNK